jgi:regulator of sigma E protease
LIDHEAKITVDQVNGRLVMRSIEVVKFEEQKQPGRRPLDQDHIYVDQNGVVVQAQEAGSRAVSRKLIKAGKTTGEMELIDIISEVHPGTRFTLNWLPLGGFVRPKGENDPNVPGGLAAASPWKRLAVLSAGPLMNLLAAVLIYSFIVTRAGVPTPEHIVIADLVENSPAAEADIQKGDILREGNGQPIRGYEDLRSIIDPSEGRPVIFLVDRNGEQLELTVTPRRSEDDRVVIGVYFEEQYTYQPVTSPLQAVQFGARVTYNSIRTLISLPAQLLRGSLPAEQGRLIGLKGIYDIMEQSVTKDVQASKAPSTDNPFDQMRTLSLIASLSISLGLFNLFPFPALDGGRIIFILPELIFRRRVSPQLENMVHAAGMAFLLLLMIYINVMDFINPASITIP